MLLSRYLEDDAHADARNRCNDQLYHDDDAVASSSTPGRTISDGRLILLSLAATGLLVATVYGLYMYCRKRRADKAFGAIMNESREITSSFEMTDAAAEGGGEIARPAKSKWKMTTGATVRAENGGGRSGGKGLYVPPANSREGDVADLSSEEGPDV